MEKLRGKENVLHGRGSARFQEIIRAGENQPQ